MNVKKSHWPLTLMGGGVSVLNMLLPMILVRILTPEEIGNYKIYFLYISMVPWIFLSSGISNGLSHWAGHDSKRMEATRSSWAISASIALSILCIGTLFHRPLAHALEWDSTKTQLLVWAAAFSLVANFFDDVSVAHGFILRGAVFSSGFDLFRNLAMAGAAYHFRNVAAIFWAHTVVVTIKVILGVSWGYWQGFQRPSFNPESLRAVWRYAFPVSGAVLLSIAINNFDQILLTKTLSAADFASYSFGCLLLPPLNIFETSVNRVLIPKLSRAFAHNQGVLACGLFRDAVSEISWLLIPSGIGLAIFAKPIVSLLFTTTYIGAAFFLKIYSINYLFHPLPFDVVARARGKGTWILRLYGFFASFSIISIFLAVRFGGAKGAIIASVTALSAMKIWAMISVQREENWAWSKMFPWQDWGKYFLFSLIGTVLAFLLKGPTGGGLLWLIIGGGIFAIIYLGGTYKVFLKNQKRLSPDIV